MRIVRALACAAATVLTFMTPAPASAIDVLLEKARQDGTPRPASGEALTA